jgi:lipid II:glycine glycyltransferase (peptidoglycan interpeptide bridge formation enzyme)
MEVIINKEVNIQKWNQLLGESSFTSPFQTPEFYHFFNSLGGFSADVFAVEDEGKFKSIVVVTVQKESGLKSFFSRRGIVYGGIVVLEDSAGCIDNLLNYISDYYSKKLIYLEIRNYFNYSIYKDVLQQNNFNYTEWLNFHLNTSDEVSMKKAMSSSRLRQIKKAIKSGVEWREAETIEEVSSFYSILENLYHNKIKKPLLPRDFFLDFYKQEIGKYLLIFFNEKIIGGIMCPIMPEKAIYEFYVCGFDKEFKDQYPSVMATWAAMEYANQNNISIFDFMGAGKPDEDYGVRDFKARFGGELVEYGRFTRILNPLLFNVGKLGLKILSKLK